VTKQLADTAIGSIERRVPRASIGLESWVEQPWSNGIQVDTLRDLDVLHVQTVNTMYEIRLVSARTGEAIVRGGRFFPEPTRAVILGSSLGGAFLKLRGIYCGFSLEVHALGIRVITSAVQSVQFVADPAPAHVQ
jgi:hypothetical protein